MISTEQLFAKRCLQRRSGFTLVELIVATGITLLLATLLLSITAGIMSAWNRSRGDLTTSNQAKLALDQIAADLQSAIIHADGEVWLAATVQPDQSGTGDAGASIADWNASGGGQMKPGWSNPGTLGSSLDVTIDSSIPAEARPLEAFRFGMAGVWLRFFSAEPDANDTIQNVSSPRAIAYQILRYKPSDSSSDRFYGLYRSSVRPTGSSSTFSVGYELFANGDGAKTEYNIGSATDGDAGCIRRPNKSSLVANHVIDFGVRIWIRNPSGDLVVGFPTGDANLGFAARIPMPIGTEKNVIPQEPAVGAPTFTQMNYGSPEVVEIFLRGLSDEGANLIKALETGKKSGDWWAIAKANSAVFIRRIDVKSKAAFLQ